MLSMNKVDLYDLYQISLQAGQEILKVYDQDFSVGYKADESPLTVADQKAHESIVEGLQALEPSLPILSEEGREISYEERRSWREFWLVDPLDGTKEFVKRNGEFTVNIALIEDQYPTIGFIYAPALDCLYFGQEGVGAYKLEHASEIEIKSEEALLEASERLPKAENRENIQVVASRSHMSEETEAFIEELETQYKNVDVVSSGSSLKFCLVAEGTADYYPRYAPTMEWDTGAGQAIVEASGGRVLRHKDKERFDYNREDLLNGWFLVENYVEGEGKS
jgi:3'(2'), 5'-bisphosphate nucleotidase